MKCHRCAHWGGLGAQRLVTGIVVGPCSRVMKDGTAWTERDAYCKHWTSKQWLRVDDRQREVGRMLAEAEEDE